MKRNIQSPGFSERVFEKTRQRNESYELESQISAEKQRQEFRNNIKTYAPHENMDIPSRRSDNANIVKIIWQLKLRTTLLHNVINQILYKWPEDSASVLEIVEKNRQKYENSPPRDLINLVESKDVSYEKVLNNPVFDLPNKPFPSRVKSSRLGGNSI